MAQNPDPGWAHGSSPSPEPELPIFPFVYYAPDVYLDIPSSPSSSPTPPPHALRQSRASLCVPDPDELIRPDDDDPQVVCYTESAGDDSHTGREGNEFEAFEYSHEEYIDDSYATHRATNAPSPPESKPTRSDLGFDTMGHAHTGWSPTGTEATLVATPSPWALGIKLPPSQPTQPILRYPTGSPSPVRNPALTLPPFQTRLHALAEAASRASPSTAACPTTAAPAITATSSGTSPRAASPSLSVAHTAANNGGPAVAYNPSPLRLALDRGAIHIPSHIRSLIPAAREAIDSIVAGNDPNLVPNSTALGNMATSHPTTTSSTIQTSNPALSFHDSPRRQRAPQKIPTREAVSPVETSSSLTTGNPTSAKSNMSARSLTSSTVSLSSHNAASVAVPIRPRSPLNIGGIRPVILRQPETVLDDSSSQEVYEAYGPIGDRVDDTLQVSDSDDEDDIMELSQEEWDAEELTRLNGGVEAEYDSLNDAPNIELIVDNDLIANGDDVRAYGSNEAWVDDTLDASRAESYDDILEISKEEWDEADITMINGGTIAESFAVVDDPHPGEVVDSILDDVETPSVRRRPKRRIQYSDDEDEDVPVHQEQVVSAPVSLNGDERHQSIESRLPEPSPHADIMNHCKSGLKPLVDRENWHPFNKNNVQDFTDYFFTIQDLQRQLTRGDVYDTGLFQTLTVIGTKKNHGPLTERLVRMAQKLCAAFEERFGETTPANVDNIEASSSSRLRKRKRAAEDFGLPTAKEMKDWVSTLQIFIKGKTRQSRGAKTVEDLDSIFIRLEHFWDDLSPQFRSLTNMDTKLAELAQIDKSEKTHGFSARAAALVSRMKAKRRKT